MSFTRNRSQSSHSPNVKPRALQLHLQGAQDAMRPSMDMNLLVQRFSQSVLDRPSGRQRMSVLERVVGEGTPLGFSCCSMVSTMNDLEPGDVVQVVHDWDNRERSSWASWAFSRSLAPS
jgi:hypothetical protein